MGCKNNPNRLFNKNFEIIPTDKNTSIPLDLTYLIASKSLENITYP